MSQPLLSWLAAAFSSGLLAFLPSWLPGDTAPSSWGEYDVHNHVPANAMLLLGDVQLGRAVERTILREGEAYPYERIAPVLSGYDFVLANFEGAVPAEHQPTPDLSVVFSVAAKRLSALRSAGITHVSVANNHSLDQGEAGYHHTLAALREARLTALEMPTTSPAQITRLRLGAHWVSIVAIDAVMRGVDEEIMREVLAREESVTDAQVAYVHWGSEYRNWHGPSQSGLAHWLIDQGVDVIVGHHPHVVQDVELYQGKPIVYSLGNFIFDQYFSPAVQVGMMVELRYESELSLRFLPVTSLDRQNSPRLMSQDEQREFLQALASRSEPGARSLILASLPPAKPLAISP